MSPGRKAGECRMRNAERGWRRLVLPIRNPKSEIRHSRLFWRGSTPPRCRTWRMSRRFCSLRTRTSSMLLFGFADQVRREYVGDGVLLRGLIEFSNVCRNACHVLRAQQAQQPAPTLPADPGGNPGGGGEYPPGGIKTVVLQSGEEDNLDSGWLRQVIEEIKGGFDMAVTLWVGERRREEYRVVERGGGRQVSAQDRDIRPRPLSSAASRDELREQNTVPAGPGGAGLPDRLGQPRRSQGADASEPRRRRPVFQAGQLRHDQRQSFHPAPADALADEPAGDLTMTLKMTALARIVSRNAHIPATTAIGSLHGRDERPRALAAGANVLMPNFTPAPYRRSLRDLSEQAMRQRRCGCLPGCMEQMVAAMGRWVDYGRGDSLKRCRVCMCTPSPTMVRVHDYREKVCGAHPTEMKEK